MTRRTVTASLGSLLVGLLIALNAPAVSADAPCILDNAGNCASTQALAAQGMSTNEYDAVLTALEMTSTANSIPSSASLTDSAGEPDAQMPAIAPIN